MKKAFIGIFIILFSVTLIFFISGYGETETRIGILDRERIVNESSRAQQLEVKLSDIGERLEQEYKMIEEEGEETEQELENIYQQFLLNKEELEEKLNKEINEVINEIADEMNYEVILLKESTKFGGEEVTSQIIERLDEKFYQKGD